MRGRLGDALGAVGCWAVVIALFGSCGRLLYQDATNPPTPRETRLADEYGGEW